MSDNIDDPFQPLSEIEQKEAFYRHKILVDCEKARRPTNPNIPEEVEVLEIEPVSIRYHLRSFADKLDFNQYGSNVGNINIKTFDMPRSRPTDNPSQTAEAEPSSRPETSKRPGQAQVISSSSSESERDSKSPVHDSAIKSVLNDDDDSDEEVNQGGNAESPERAEMIDIMAQVTHEESLDEEYESETDEADFRQPLILPSNSKVAEATVSKVWLKLAKEKEYCRKAKIFYGLPDGYELILPPPSATVLDCPDGHIAVYAKHFEFGLRFPLHPFIAKIFKAWNVCLVQVTPPTIHAVISLIWVLIYKNFPLTLNLFRRLITLKRDGKSEGWWSLYTASHKFTVNPKLSSCKGWQDKFFFMSVPEDFPIRRTFFRPHPHFGHIAERELGPQEQKACDYFDAVRVNIDGKTRVVPKVWLPNVKYILNNAPLSYISLCRTNNYGPHKLDKTALGLSSDGRRVLFRFPPSPRPALETFTSFCSRAPTRNPKRRAEEMDDENVRRNRRLTSLANRRGGIVPSISTRKEDGPESKRSKTDTEQPKAPSPPKTSALENADKAFEDLTASPIPQQETVPISAEPQQVGPVISDVSAPGITYRGEQWIEHVEGKILDEVLNRVRAPEGRSRDQWRPEMDVFRNESIFTDDPLRGGNLGYRLLRNVSTPVDRPSGQIGLVAAQHTHDLMRAVASGTELVEMYRFYQDKYHQNTSNQQSLETALKNAKRLLMELSLEGQLQKIEADKPGIRKRAVSRYLSSAEFCSRLQYRFDGGWTAAQRCAAHVIGLKQEDWAKIEAAFNNDAHKTPSGFEQQEFSDADIFNLAPSDDIGVSDPKILDSPEPENKTA
uniref:Uncharacterized protein n=1 Tax=Chenopodium quinoa TaxID=63459 RepID=A0A803MHT3_CHEQI